MAEVIAILDDEPDRIEAMVSLLAIHCPSLTAITFDSAPAMNDWLAKNLELCALICLDHDLGPVRLQDKTDSTQEPGETSPTPSRLAARYARFSFIRRTHWLVPA